MLRCFEGELLLKLGSRALAGMSVMSARVLFEQRAQKLKAQRSELTKCVLAKAC